MVEILIFLRQICVRQLANKLTFVKLTGTQILQRTYVTVKYLTAHTEQFNSEYYASN